MKLVSYLSFNGQCEDAFKLYEKCLGGRITFKMTYGESPMAAEAPEGWGNKIMHATLTAGNNILQGADATPKQYEKPQGFSISIGLSDAAEAERVFQGLSESGTVQMPLQETFWALRFGVFTDRYGIPWMINCEKPANP